MPAMMMYLLVMTRLDDVFVSGDQTDTTDYGRFCTQNLVSI